MQLSQMHLCALIRQNHYKTVLLIGASAPRAASVLAAMTPPVLLEQTHRPPPATILPHDLVYVADLFAEHSGKLATRSLATLKNYCSGMLMVEYDSRDGYFDATDFFALGFRLHPLPVTTGSSLRLYCYSLHSYKAPPQWLNAASWAHPERWNLDWDT